MAKTITSITLDKESHAQFKKIGGSTWLNNYLLKDIAETTEIDNQMIKCEDCGTSRRYALKYCPQCKMEENRIKHIKEEITEKLNKMKRMNTRLEHFKRLESPDEIAVANAQRYYNEARASILELLESSDKKYSDKIMKLIKKVEAGEINDETD
jgi:hypothetical protein